jgi:hypothetical protein
MKKCAKCKVEKEITCFGKRADNNDGLMHQCKECRKEFQKEYYKKNKHKAIKYYENNKQKIKEYRKNNKDKLKEYIKEYRKNNKDKLKEYKKNNKQKIREKNKEYRKNNRVGINEYQKKYNSTRLKEDPLYKMKSNLRSRTYKAFKHKGYSKKTKTQEMLGIDWEIAKKHIERQFTKGMNWSNQGDWHIDHIIPLSSANTEERLKKLCHYTNLQPLWAVDNLIKSDVINGQQNKFRF